MPRTYTKSSLSERLLRRRKITPSGCWEWQGAVNNKGYGVFSLGNGRVAFTHRVSFAVLVEGATEFDKSSQDYLVLHRCDNPKCFNPEHLFQGSHKDNVGDMDAKGRRVSVVRAGEFHPMVKLSDEQVANIRAAYAASPKYPSGRVLYGVVSDLAKKFKVSITTISAIGRMTTRTKGSSYEELRNK